MPDFSKGSTFNKNANFQGVIFGADAPLLETELNELQDIQTEARADIIRDSIPSGFIQLGELDYDYMSSFENTIKMKSDSIAYVNGYRVEIPKGTVIDIGKSPETTTREDLIFLEVWKEEVTKDSNLTEAGGVGQASTTNNILDPRVGQETSRRVALKWRIRHVEDLDFNATFMTTVTSPYHPYIGWNDTLNFSKVFVMGGDDSITAPQVITGLELYRGATSAWKINKPINDLGLWVGGIGDTYSKNRYKSVDGFVYAIPMFRLYRKPNCGKAKPFEYQKINPKVDYSKFTKLINNERVERIESEQIKGRSLVNLATILMASGAGSSSSASITPINYGYKFAKINGNAFYPRFTLKFPVIKPETTYTLSYKIKSSESMKLGFCIAYGDSYLGKSQSTNSVFFNDDVGTGIEKTVTMTFTTQSPNNMENGDICLGFGAMPSTSHKVEITNLVLLEGEVPSNEIPKYLEGLKSLGEDNNNLIEVKNSILNFDSYDPTTGNLKLNALSGKNNILSKNLIQPKVVAQIKRGESNLGTINDFNTPKDLVGDEVIEFTSIQGQTFNNLHSAQNYEIAKSGITEDVDYRVTKSSKYIKIERLTSTKPSYAYINCGMIAKSLLKPSTAYTVIFEKANNITHACIRQGDSQNPISNQMPITNNRVVLTTEPDVTIGGGQILYVSFSYTSDLNNITEVSNAIILEGDWSEVPLDNIPFTDSIKSVGEDGAVEILNCNKNLFDYDYHCASSDGRLISKDNTMIHMGHPTNFPVKNNFKFGKTYVVSVGELVGGASRYRFELYVDSVKLIDSMYKLANEKFTFTMPYVGYGKLSFKFWASTQSTTLDGYGIKNPQIEEGSNASDFTPYKESVKRITLKEPLRKVSSTAYDEIVGNIVKRRIYKVVLNGTENIYSNIAGDNYIRFAIAPSALPYRTSDNNRNVICDRFPSGGDTTNRPSVFIYTQSGIIFCIEKSRLSSPDIAGFKAWLAQNPTTVYYEMESPIEEFIEPNYSMEAKKTYQLNQPLRGIPNGAYDEIIDNKLIKRCDEIIFNGTETWIYKNETSDSSILCFYTNILRDIKKDGIKSPLVCDRLNYTESNSGLEGEGLSNATSNGAIYIQVKSSRLTTPDVEGLNAWLKKNPIKVIYELINPREIILTEVKYSETNFNAQRLFNNDKWLRELPNGVKDTIEDGKVIRRVGLHVIKNTSTITKRNEGDGVNTISFQCTDLTDLLKLSSPVETCFLADRFKPSQPSTDGIEGIGIGSNNEIFVEILRNRLATRDEQGFKDWLAKNPITILYELKTPTEEVITEYNSLYCPPHKLNSYCGSLYLSNGVNHLALNNLIPSSYIKALNYSRGMINKDIITNCDYKKVDYSYETNVYTSKSKNMFSLNVYEPNARGSYITINKNLENGYTVSTGQTVQSDWGLSTYYKSENPFKLNNLRKGTKIFCKAEGTYTGLWLSLKKVSDGKRIGKIYDNSKEFTYELEDDCVDIEIVFTKPTPNTTFTVYNIMIGYGELPTSFEPAQITERSWESIDGNSIEDLRSLVSLTGYDYERVLTENFEKLLRGEL